MIRIYFKTTPIIIKFLEQCILSMKMPVSKYVFVVNINFVRHHTIRGNLAVVFTGVLIEIVKLYV